MFNYEKIAMEEPRKGEHSIFDTKAPKSNWLMANGFLIFTLILMTLMMVVSEKLSIDLRYDRELLENGQWWRLITGHLQHLGWEHYMLNAVALVFVWLVVGDSHTLLQWITSFLLLTILISLSFRLYYPDIHWYVGMSGVIHGFLVSGLIAVIIRLRELFPAIILLAVAIKVTWEHLHGGSSYMAEVIGGNVVTESHLIGAVVGIGTGIIFGIANLKRP